MPSTLGTTTSAVLSSLGDHENTRKVLRDICLHPNAGAVLVLSLGCENNQPDEFMEMLGDYDKDRIKLLVTQQVEGDELEVGMDMLGSSTTRLKLTSVRKFLSASCA